MNSPLQTANKILNAMPLIAADWRLLALTMFYCLCEQVFKQDPQYRPYSQNKYLLGVPIPTRLG